MSIEVRVPTLGESVTEATVATWFKKPGDTIAVDEMLCELETDKVTVEVPSPTAGVLGEIVAAEGETVGVDALLATISEAGNAGPEEVAPRHNADTAQATPAAASGASVDVMVPTLGESVTEATVSTWFKSVGDTVAQDEMLCELETDKVSVEVPAPAAGTLTEIVAPEGATVDATAKLAVIAQGASAAQGHVRSGYAPQPRPRGGHGRQGCRRRPQREKGHGRDRPLQRSGHRHGPRWPRDEGRRAKGPGRQRDHRGPHPGCRPARAGAR